MTITPTPSLATVLNVVLTLLLSILTYFLKRFVDSVYAIEARMDKFGERIATMEGKLQITPRRRKDDQ